VRPVHHFEEAEVILSLDADFLSAAANDTVANTRGFARSRRIEETGSMSRLYAVESGYSITGGMADHRLRLKSGDVVAFAASLAGAFGLHETPYPAFDDHPWIPALVDDLSRAGSRALVIAGDHQPEAVHTLAAAINFTLGAIGTTVSVLDVPDESVNDVQADMRMLVASLESDSVDVLVTLGVNPVYDHPGLTDAFARAGERIHVGMYVDETARGASWHVPQAHYLEAWGDGRSRTGHAAIIQPLISPLYDDAHSDLEVLGLLATGQEQFGYDLVRDTWRGMLPGSFEDAWRKVVHDGFLPDSGYPTVTPPATMNNWLRSNVFAAVSAFTGAKAADLEVVINLDGKVLDGRYANNAWLQELPDATTKVVWDNVAAMNPATAERLGLKSRLSGGKYLTDMATITVGSASVDLPVWIQPGMADDSIHVTTGYGRDIQSNRPFRNTNLFDLDDYTDVYGSGAISSGVGSSVSTLMQGGSRIVSAASVTKSGSDYMVASTQDHGAMEEEGREVQKRGLFRMATVAEYRANPDFVEGGEPAPLREDWGEYPSLWEGNHPKNSEEITSSRYHENQWGMVIDLNTCTGCNACVVACQSENNIQVVGKEEVSRGREMHWIRMDRYFVSGDGASFEEPQMVLQPIPCMHCENAPCEQVCPVAATVHSPDGTNQMIYNRCIGTRYCANNCPYKVRRFNFFNWSKHIPTSVRMAQNPNVTVRSRGVMEKCSYCIQRIREVNKTTNLENRPIRDGEVVTACQQACPAQAITFGDLTLADSAVSKKRQSNRRYELLAELAVKPRTSYLGRIRNPNPSLQPNDNA
jgi:molybdopterin-containing oxidoreductase family iron-sulfur binding subunit